MDHGVQQALQEDGDGPIDIEATILRFMDPAPHEQTKRLKQKLLRMEEEDAKEVKVKQCLEYMREKKELRLIDILAISYILNDGKILIASHYTEECIDKYWENLTKELGDAVTKSVSLEE